MCKRLRIITPFIIVLLWGGCILFVIVSLFKTPEKYKDYPYAPTDIFSECTIEKYVGMPMYILAEIEALNTSENLIVARSEAGCISLSEDELWSFSCSLPSVSEHRVKLFFVYLGWNGDRKEPYGYYLATISNDGTSTGLAAYSEVKGYYESRLHYDNIE